jgi:hypothetical protein
VVTDVVGVEAEVEVVDSLVIKDAGTGALRFFADFFSLGLNERATSVHRM